MDDEDRSTGGRFRSEEIRRVEAEASARLRELDEERRRVVRERDRRVADLRAEATAGLDPEREELCLRCHQPAERSAMVGGICRGCDDAVDADADAARRMAEEFAEIAEVLERQESHDTPERARVRRTQAVWIGVYHSQEATWSNAEAHHIRGVILDEAEGLRFLRDQPFGDPQRRAAVIEEALRTTANRVVRRLAEDLPRFRAVLLEQVEPVRNVLASRTPGVRDRRLGDVWAHLWLALGVAKPNSRRIRAQATERSRRERARLLADE
ncbi:MAG: hypothetical protein AAF715_32535 [Myxococcota bacterium]